MNNSVIKISKYFWEVLFKHTFMHFSMTTGYFFFKNSLQDIKFINRYGIQNTKILS